MEKLNAPTLSLAKKLWFKTLLSNLLASGYSKTEIAQRIGISPQRLTNLINGSDSLTDKVIDSFSSVFQLGNISIESENSVPTGSVSDYKTRIIDRLEQYLILCGVTEEQATVNAKVDSGLFKKMHDDSKDITVKEAELFLAAFPDLNKEWLLKGQGEMRNNNALPFQNRKEPMARILQLLNEEGITLEEFARAVNSSVKLFNNAIKWPYETKNLILGNEKEIHGWVNAFCDVFPKYSKFWILTGKTSKYNFPIADE